MKNYVKNYIGSCAECLYHKQPGGKKPGMLHPIDKIGIHYDHLGPFVKSLKGNSYVLVAIDGFTKFCFLKSVRNTKSTTTVRVIEDLSLTLVQVLLVSLLLTSVKNITLFMLKTQQLHQERMVKLRG